MKRRAAPGGFTLLEVAVAVALSVIVIGAATTVLSAVLVQNKRQRIHSDLQRDAELVGQLLATELRQAGLGVPQGPHIQKNCPGGVCTFTYGTGANTTSAGLRFGAHRLLVAAPTEIGLVGDLPRPDSNYPVFGPLHSRHSGAGTGILAWHNESNGTCIPPGCATSGFSTFFPGSGIDCSTVGGEITCPWALRRVARGDRLQVVDGRGDWAHAGVDTAGAVGGNSSLLGVLGLRLSPAMDPSANSWLNDSAGVGPSGFAGQGFVTTLDRVFYVFDSVAGVIRRTQCFGDPDPGHADWPESANTVPGSPGTITPPVTAPSTSAQNRCVGPEVVARHVTSVAFTYFDQAGAAVAVASNADKDSIRRVEWVIGFQNANTIVGTPVTYTLMGAVSLQN